MSKEFSARMWTTKLNKNRLQNTDYKWEEQSAGEIPLLLLFFYLFGEAELDLNVHFLALRSLFCRSIRAEDTVRLGVWLGRHNCQMITQVS